MDKAMKEELYRQVKLVCGQKHVVTHILNKSAVVGCSMKIQPYGSNELSADRWTVEEVYGEPIPASLMKEQERRHKHWHEKVDI